MNVLLVDDEPVTRTLLRRVLVRQFSCDVIEAVDGVGALAALTRQPIDLVITDLRMPNLTGLELLEAIRRFPPLARLPVVIMSVERTEDTVRAALQLGIDGFFVKPLDANVVTAKLAELVQAIAATAAAPSTAGGPVANAADTFLVADGNADFRHLFVGTFSSSRPVLYAATGVDALLLAGASQPSVVFIGDDLGPLGGDLLVRKLRSHPRLDRTKLVAIRRRHAREPLAGVDSTVVRSLVPDAVRQQVEALFGPFSGEGGVLIARSALRTQLGSACEQVFGMMLGLDVEPSLTESPSVPAGALATTQFIDWADGNERLDCTLSLDDRSAVRVAAAMLHTPEAQVTPEHAQSVAAELCQAITERLKAWYAAAGTRVHCSLPVTARSEQPWLASADRRRVFTACLTAERDFVCVVTLTAVGSVPGGVATGTATLQHAPVGSEA